MDRAILRGAKISDYKDLKEIIRTSLGYDSSDEIIKNKLKMIDIKRENIYVAEIKNKVVGFIHIEKYETLFFDMFVNILGLAVAAEFRRKGIGEMLVKVAEDWAKSVGATGIRLNSGEDRKGAHEFYKRIGFNVDKKQLRFNKIIDIA